MPIENRRIRPPKKKAENGKVGSLKGKGKIKVVVRKRPMHGKEEMDIIKAEEGNEVIVKEVKKRLDLSEYIEVQAFKFDASFGEYHETADVYKVTAKPLVDVFLKGGNASVFAYGQTGSGKTHTMIGDSSSKGMYILAASDIFEQLDSAPPSFSIKASLFEIYCEKLIDLMGGKKQVHAREGPDGKVKICGLTEHLVRSEAEMLKLVAASSQHRACGSTAANSQSSRSHAILRLHLCNNEREVSSLTFVDLAGSERGADTAERDKKTQREGSEINKSLLALKECIRGMDMGHKHVKFRGSKLTEVLKQSFTGECRTCMVATVSPSKKDTDHTMNTLRYAHRVKSLPPVKTTKVNQRLMPASNVPLVAKAGYRGEREREKEEQTDSSADTTNSSIKAKRPVWAARLGNQKQSSGCTHCGSSAHHTLLCRKPQHFPSKTKQRPRTAKSRARPVTVPTPVSAPPPHTSLRRKSPPPVKAVRPPQLQAPQVVRKSAFTPCIQEKFFRRAASVPASMP